MFGQLLWLHDGIAVHAILAIHPFARRLRRARCRRRLQPGHILRVKLLPQTKRDSKRSPQYRILHRRTHHSHLRQQDDKAPEHRFGLGVEDLWIHLLHSARYRFPRHETEEGTPEPEGDGRCYGLQAEGLYSGSDSSFLCDFLHFREFTKLRSVNIQGTVS